MFELCVQQCAAVVHVGPAYLIAQQLIFTGILEIHDPGSAQARGACAELTAVNVMVHTSISRSFHAVFCIVMLIVGEEGP